jgi:hypothetical protein
MIRASDVEVFNSSFFCKIGGLKSLLFCPSPETFQEDIWRRLHDLRPLYDVVDYLFKMAAIAPELTSLEFALQVTSENVFGQRYGSLGFEALRARWKGRPSTLIIGYVLFNYCNIASFPPGNSRFVSVLSVSAARNRGASIRNIQKTVEDVLSTSRVSKQSSLAQLLPAQKSDRVSRIKVHSPTDDQINKILKVAQTYLKQPISVERAKEIRQAAKEWYKRNTTRK